MTFTHTSLRIEEDVKKNALIEIVSDKYCRAILEDIMYKPKSVIEITAQTGIPISTVYRRIQTLCDNKLLSISGSISHDGKKFFIYKSKIKSINAKFDEGKTKVEMILN